MSRCEPRNLLTDVLRESEDDGVGLYGFLDDSSRISSPSNEESIAPQIARSCMHSTGEHVLNAAAHTLRTLRIFLITTALSGRWLHQLFLQLDHYGDAPSKTAQKTWLSLPIMSGNALLTLLLAALNYRHAKKNHGEYLAAEDYAMSTFTSAIVFFAMDAVSAAGHSRTLPLGWFIAMSSLGIPIVSLLLMGHALPDSSNQFTFSLTSLQRRVQRASRSEKMNASSPERCMNAVNAMVKYAFPSLSILFSVINRENDGATTIPLFTWQIGLIGLYFIFAGKVGFEITHHKRFYQAWAAFSKGLKEAALTFYALSAIVFVATVYQCADRTFCLGENAKTFFNYAMFALSMGMGLYGAATTHVRFKKQHASNFHILSAVDRAKDRVTYFATSVAKKCCQRDDGDQFDALPVFADP